MLGVIGSSIKYLSSETFVSERVSVLYRNYWCNLILGRHRRYRRLLDEEWPSELVLVTQPVASCVRLGHSLVDLLLSTTFNVTMGAISLGVGIVTSGTLRGVATIIGAGDGALIGEVMPEGGWSG